jgi:hypothetical protein
MTFDPENNESSSPKQIWKKKLVSDDAEEEKAITLGVQPANAMSASRNSILPVTQIDWSRFAAGTRAGRAQFPLRSGAPNASDHKRFAVVNAIIAGQDVVGVAQNSRAASSDTQSRSAFRRKKRKQENRGAKPKNRGSTGVANGKPCQSNLTMANVGNISRLQRSTAEDSSTMQSSVVSGPPSRVSNKQRGPRTKNPRPSSEQSHNGRKDGKKKKKRKSRRNNKKPNPRKNKGSGSVVGPGRYAKRNKRRRQKAAASAAESYASMCPTLQRVQHECQSEQQDVLFAKLDIRDCHVPVTDWEHPDPFDFQGFGRMTKRSPVTFSRLNQVRGVVQTFDELTE